MLRLEHRDRQPSIVFALSRVLHEEQLRTVCTVSPHRHPLALLYGLCHHSKGLGSDMVPQFTFW